MRGIFKSAAIVSFSILASRVLGLVRDVVIASTFGAGSTTDVFFVAFRVPNLLRRIFAEGAFNSAFVPAFTKKLKLSPKEASEFAGSFFTVLTSLLLATVLLGELLSPLIVKLLAPGFKGSDYLLAVKLLRELFPYIFFVSLVAFFGGILNSLGHFFAPAFSTVLFNLSLILCVLFLSKELSIESLSVGVILGGLLQLVLQLFFIRELSFPFKPLFKITSDVLKTLKNTLPGIFGFAVRQISMLIDTVIASFLQVGAISYLYYANRFVQLPLGMFAIGLSQVLLPRFSSKERREDLRRELLDGITLCTFIIVPSAVGLLFFGKPIVDLIFNHGRFTEVALNGTYLVLVGYTLGLLPFSLEKIVVNAFYSTEEFKLPVFVSASTLAFNLIVDLILCFPLELGVLGLALGTTLTSFLNLNLLSLFLSRRLNFSLFKPIYLTSLRYLLFSIPVAPLCIFSSHLYFSLNSFTLKLLTVVLTLLLSSLLYFLTLFLFKDKVFNSLFRKEV
ncbi:murein biosynthesis integral membrane protein MurJ [Thermovibrio sp.]